MKKFIYVLIAIILIVCGCLLAKNIIDNKETVETSQNFNNVIENTNRIENKLNNGSTNNIVQNNTIKNETIENKNEEDGQGEKEQNKEEQTMENKAINLAKKDWGTDDSVYFSYEYKDNKGRYVISVRNKETTKAEFWYTIDMETEKIID